MLIGDYAKSLASPVVKRNKVEWANRVDLAPFAFLGLAFERKKMVGLKNLV